jgi:hypothetical protein
MTQAPPPQVWPTLSARDARALIKFAGQMAPGTFSAHAVCDDPGALFSRAAGNGAVVITGLHDTDYGSRDFAVLDPEGNRWYPGAYRGHPRSARRLAGGSCSSIPDVRARNSP